MMIVSRIKSKKINIKEELPTKTCRKMYIQKFLGQDTFLQSPAYPQLAAEVSPLSVPAS